MCTWTYSRVVNPTICLNCVPVCVRLLKKKKNILKSHRTTGGAPHRCEMTQLRWVRLEKLKWCNLRMMIINGPHCTCASSKCLKRARPTCQSTISSLYLCKRLRAVFIIALGAAHLLRTVTYRFGQIQRRERSTEFSLLCRLSGWWRQTEEQKARFKGRN